MKKYSLLLILILVLTNLHSSELIYGNVHCKIIDSHSKKPLSDVSIGIQDDEHKVSKYVGSTNKEGKADLGVRHTNILIIVQKNGYVSRIVKPGSKETTIKLFKNSNLDKGMAKQDFEKMINKLLEFTEYSNLSYRISRAIINGESFIKVSSKILNQLPKGPAISIPGIFEMNLRVKNEKLVWVLDGSLVNEFIELGIIPNRSKSF